MPDVLRCSNCGKEVAPLMEMSGHMVIQVEYPKATIYAARVRCPSCKAWMHFSARRKEVATATK